MVAIGVLFKWSKINVYSMCSRWKNIENEQFDVLEIFYGHRVDEHIKEDTLCRVGLDSIVVERPVVRHLINFINNDDE